MHSVFSLAVITTFSPQLVKRRLRGNFGVWLNPTHSNGMHQFHNLSVFPLGGNKTTFGFRDK